MLRIIGCITQQHDLWLVVLAALVCALGSFSTISLLNARQAAQRRRTEWLVASAVTSGFAIWATHFIAMLAFHLPGNAGYDVPLTALSLVISVVLTGAGFARAVATEPAGASGALWLRLEGGAIVGFGICAMHFTGMAALEFDGHLRWSADLVLAAVVAAPVAAAASLSVGLNTERKHHTLLGSALFAAAVCMLHFIAMSAVTLELGTVAADDGTQISHTTLAVGTALVGAGLLGLAMLSVELNRRSERRRIRQTQRLKDLADAAVEGLVVTDGAVLLVANRSFRTLSGLADVTNIPLAQVFNDLPQKMLEDNDVVATECMLHSGSGEDLPVEIIARPVNFDGEPRQVIAVRDLRERRRAEREIAFLAYSDALTGLPNRRRFTDSLQEALLSAERYQSQLAVLAVDLDRFKQVNDTLGHGIGDKLLCKVSRRLSAVLRSTDLLARMGGDEFAILVNPVEQSATPALIAERAVEVLSRPFLIDGHVITIGCSTGIALYPSDALTGEELIKNADLALYRAKSEGRGQHAFFEPEMDADMQRRRLLELDLHSAIARREFVLHFQPLLDREGQIASYEALIRWMHPSKGLVPPDTFIPVAEETGLIIPIGEWVLMTACQRAARWPEQVSIAVNLSSVQFRCPHLVGSVNTALKKSGLTPNRLVLEITESVLLQDNLKTLATLRELHDLGVRISMDDFGTGYSSLSYLRAFPFDAIKIDRSFVRDLGEKLDSEAIVRTVILLGKSLGMSTTAEGVETEAQARFLREAGCDSLQGYLFGRPQDHVAFEDAHPTSTHMGGLT